VINIFDDEATAAALTPMSRAAQPQEIAHAVLPGVGRR
jgi:hypothetical protein